MNRLPGTIKAVQTADFINRVVVSCEGFDLSCVTLDLPEDFKQGSKVIAIFKETEVSLAKNISGTISISNQLACAVNDVDEGKILSQISLLVKDEVLSSIITTDSFKRLGIKMGDSVTALIKANEVSLERVED